MPPKSKQQKQSANAALKARFQNARATQLQSQLLQATLFTSPWHTRPKPTLVECWEKCFCPDQEMREDADLKLEQFAEE